MLPVFKRSVETSVMLTTPASVIVCLTPPSWISFTLPATSDCNVEIACELRLIAVVLSVTLVVNDAISSLALFAVAWTVSNLEEILVISMLKLKCVNV